MDKVFQVFLSSTFSDLKEERQQVSNNLAKAGYIVAGMELFPATDEQQLDYIKRVIDRCDYYVVIVGGRYGSLADQSVSFTEKEFEYAKFKKLPVLAFLHQDPRKLPVEKTDEDKDKADALVRFRGTLSTGRTVEFWDNSGDLCTKVVIAVANAINLKPGVGWIRGDQAIDPAVLQESERLRIENRDLREKMAIVDAKGLIFDPSLLGPSDSVLLRIRLGERVEPPAVEEIKSIETTFGKVFQLLYDKLLEEPSDDEVRSAIERLLWRGLKEEAGNRSFNLVAEDFQAVRTQFEALDLVKIVGVRKPDSDTNKSAVGRLFSLKLTNLHWQITEKGRLFANHHRAMRRTDAGD